MEIPALLWNKLFSGKASKTFVWFWIIFYLIANNGPEWIRALKPNKPQPPVYSSVLADTDTQATTEAVSKGSKCTSLAPLDKYGIKTEYEKMRMKGDFYYPTGTGKAWEGIVWITDFLTPNFRKVFIEYEVVPDKKSDKPPALVWVISRTANSKGRQQILKLWVPEFSDSSDGKIPQLLGFAMTHDYDSGEFKRDDSMELPDSVQGNRIDSLTIEPTRVDGNEMTVNFSYDYTSDRNGVGTSFPFTKQVIFPFSNLGDSGEKLDFGLGTYIGNKLRIVTLDVCY